MGHIHHAGFHVSVEIRSRVNDGLPIVLSVNHCPVFDTGSFLCGAGLLDEVYDCDYFWGRRSPEIDQIVDRIVRLAVVAPFDFDCDQIDQPLSPWVRSGYIGTVTGCFLSALGSLRSSTPGLA